MMVLTNPARTLPHTVQQGGNEAKTAVADAVDEGNTRSHCGKAQEHYHQRRHIRWSQRQHLCILRKELEYRCGEQQTHHSHHHKEYHAVQIARPEDLFHPVELAGTQILAKHGGGGGGDGVGDDEHNGVQLTADAEYGGIYQTITVDSSGNVKHGDIDGGGLYGQGQAQERQGFKGPPVNGETLEFKVKAETLPTDVKIDD